MNPGHMDVMETTNAPDAGAVHDDAHPATRHRHTARAGQVVCGLVGLAWLVVLGVYLGKRIVLSPDSVNNYAHVWWIAASIWHRSTLPWSMPVLGHGEAVSYPYGIVNWTTAALLWPLLGNWAITLWTALGAVGCIVATFVAFPELRRGWWAAGVLANPAIVLALLFGQQTFEWAAMLLLFGIACWRRKRPLAAALLVGLGQANHPAVVLPIGIILVAVWWRYETDRRSLVKWYSLSLLISLPAAVVVFISPAYEDSSTRDRVVNFFGTLAPRILIVAIPLAFLLLRRSRWAAIAPLALVISLGANVMLQDPVHANLAWRSLRRRPDLVAVDQFMRSPEFRPGRTYRILRGADSKLGMYAVLLAGGRLDSEFFPESADWENFHSLRAYEGVLCRHRVDEVVDFATYDKTRHTNEHRELDALEHDPNAVVRIRSIARTSAYEAFSVDRTGCDLAKERASAPSG
ncbi:MAG TPA: hypothetical protein VGI86_07355 [Acidimicrobiia bacterium]